LADRNHTVLLGVVVLSAIIIAIWEPVSAPQVLRWGEELSDELWVIALIVLAQIVLYALALPGTLILFLVAPFHSLLTSVMILLTGSVLGALAAYQVGGFLGDTWRPRRGGWLILLLKHKSDFYTQCALRILPGFPHWAVNYGAGILKVPLLPFIAAAISGLGVKWVIYCWVLQDASEAAQSAEGFGLSDLWPLLGLAVLLLLGGVLRRRMILKSRDRT
jgi:uncharacterized membrane protein YdjX (TVP38/TMEM64 family)